MNAWTVNGPELTAAEIQRNQISGAKMPLVVWGHQGLGDHILCNGLYRTLAEDWSVEVLCLRKNAPNVRLMLRDCPAIRVLEMASEKDMDQYCKGICNKMILRLGALCEGFDKWSFDREFYRQAQVPFEYRWEKCRLPIVPQVKVPPKPYVFIHDRPDFNNARLTMTGIRPDPGASIFAHRDMIMNAAEVHCVSSCFAVFADSLPENGADLHFYPFGREMPSMRHNWKIHK